MSTPSNQWYVEMSAGITLGPMPFDAVVELAETSAIMRDDRVREESSKEWSYRDSLTIGLGLVGYSLFYPLEFINIRMSVEVELQRFYSNVRECISKIKKN